MSEEISEQFFLSYDYVLDHMFGKLVDTFDKYRDILPTLYDIEQEICSEQMTDVFEGLIRVLDLLKSRSKDSVLIAEVYKNFRDDFYHGLDPKRNRKHPGKYYIDSVAD